MKVPALIAALAAVGLLAWKASDGPDATKRERAVPQQTAPGTVEKYLSALQRRDYRALRKLAPPGYDARAEIEQRVAAYGGIRSGARTSLTKDFAPDVLTLRIRATAADGRPLRWTENLVRKAPGWFVLLGSAETADAEQPSSTSDP